MTEIKKMFAEAAKFDPYDFQTQTMEALEKGKSVIVLAPTGSGKSEAIIIPFIKFRKDFLPTQLIYSLPTRTLVDSIAERAKEYSQSMRIVAHHGKRAESSLFEEDIVATTIDQTVGAYVSTPLSMPLKFGNIHAGAVSSAFLAFDEIHTFHPERGLQATMALVQQSSQMKLPIAVMSATMPRVVIDRIEKTIISHGMEVEKVIVENENEIQTRKSREVEVFPQLKTKLNRDEVINTINSSKTEKSIVICNTVEKAQTLFRDLKNDDFAVYLLHSRFLDDNRADLEQKLKVCFGKKAEESKSAEVVVFISTQVIEVGMDISADLLLTEISPMDSLIQRAGRCARWGGKGRVYVFDADRAEPYDDDLVKDTRKVLQKKSIILDWDTEIKLVNQVLGPHFEKYLDLSLMYEVLGVLSRAAYEGGRSNVEKAVREIYACDLSIHSDPVALGDHVQRLPKVRVDSRVLQSKFVQMGITLWRIDEDPYWSDYESKFYPRRVNSKEEILPFRFYVAHPKNVSYQPDEGLVFGPLGEDFTLLPEENLIRRSKNLKIQQPEPWTEHSKKVLHVFDTEFASRYDFVLTKFSEVLSMKKDELLHLMRIAIGLHDIGKLNVRWQKAIGWMEGQEPLAHCYPQTRKFPLPPHATVSAISLQKMFAPLGKSLWECFLLAIAHHHAPRAKECPAFRLVDNYVGIVEEIGLNIDTRDIAHAGKTTFLPSFIEIRGTQNKYYRLYSLLSKHMRLSDWIASGEGTYESLFHP